MLGGFSFAVASISKAARAQRIHDGTCETMKEIVALGGVSAGRPGQGLRS